MVEYTSLTVYAPCGASSIDSSVSRSASVPGQTTSAGVTGAILVAGVVLALVGVLVHFVGAAALLTLIGVIASVWARGLSIDCGCFGGGGAADVDGWDYAGEIARDLGFLALAAWLTVFPRSPLALGPGSRARLSARTQPAMAE